MAQIGNKNAAEHKRPWAHAIQQALEKRHKQGRMAAMIKIAGKLIDAAEQGDMAALKELGDRTDGKAIQAIDATVDTNVTVNILRFGGDKSPE